MHDVDFDSPWLKIYKNHKISMIRIRTLQYSVEGCVFAMLAVFVFFFVNAATTKTVNVNERFESYEWFISITSMNQTYFECYKFDVSVVLILIATCT